MIITQPRWEQPRISVNFNRTNVLHFAEGVRAIRTQDRENSVYTIVVSMTVSENDTKNGTMLQCYSNSTLVARAIIVINTNQCKKRASQVIRALQ